MTVEVRRGPLADAVRIDVYTHLPGPDRRLRDRVDPRQRARRPALLDVRTSGPREAHDGRAPDRRRHARSAAARGWSSRPDADLRRRRGRRGERGHCRPLLALTPGGPTVRPGRRPASSPALPRLLAPVRPLRGDRPAGARPLLRRRAERGRRRARGRRARRPRRHRGGRPARARRPRQRGERGGTRASLTACSSTPSTRSRRSTAGGPSPRCSARATTAGWRAGGARRRSVGRCARRPDLIARRGGLSAEEAISCSSSATRRDAAGWRGGPGPPAEARIACRS